ncbi:MAG: hypothetical protein PVH41_00280 [Anaerolineae bacterium]|jgi:uncharacterized protein YukE
MADTIRADLEALKEIGTKLRHVWHDLAEPCNRTTLAMNSLHKMWKGDAADSFWDEAYEVAMGRERMMDALEQGIEGINKIVEILDTATGEAEAAHNVRTGS